MITDWAALCAAMAKGWLVLTGFLVWRWQMNTLARIALRGRLR